MAFNITDVWTSSPMEKEMGKSDIYQAIKDAASLYGVNDKELMQLAQIESNFDPKARADNKGLYRGLFQLDPMNYPPFNPSRLEDPFIGAELGAKEYKKLKDDTFLKRVIKYNQGNKGGRQILNASIAGESIKDHSSEPWNRTKKILNNLSDTNLEYLANKHGLKGKTREQLIHSMVGDLSSGRKSQKHILEDDPEVVSLYMEEQQGKVDTSSNIVDKILKETK